MSEYINRILSKTPLRLNDIGGWTDTWFSGEGKVLNMAVYPPVEVEMKIYENRERRADRVSLHAVDFGIVFRIDPDKPDYSIHPLLQAALNSIPVPEESELDISIHSPFPPGSAVGTSASVCIAVLGALAELLEAPLNRKEIVSLAHRVETEKLGLQSGIQDQICAAYGGISYIQIPSFPKFEVETIGLEPDLLEELNNRLFLIYLGKAHSSSELHRQVIASIEAKDMHSTQMQILRELAVEAKESLEKGNVRDLGRLMIENNEAQRNLHPELISPEADAVAGLAEKNGAVGWKVNGAGGSGGSISLLASPEAEQRSAMLEQIGGLGKGIKNLPIRLSISGLTVEKEVCPKKEKEGD